MHDSKQSLENQPPCLKTIYYGNNIWQETSKLLVYKDENSIYGEVNAPCQENLKRRECSEGLKCWSIKMRDRVRSRSGSFGVVRSSVRFVREIVKNFSKGKTLSVLLWCTYLFELYNFISDSSLNNCSGIFIKVYNPIKSIIEPCSLDGFSTTKEYPGKTVNTFSIRFITLSFPILIVLLKRSSLYKNKKKLSLFSWQIMYVKIKIGGKKRISHQYLE